MGKKWRQVSLMGRGDGEGGVCRVKVMGVGGVKILEEEKSGGRVVQVVVPLGVSKVSEEERVRGVKVLGRGDVELGSGVRVVWRVEEMGAREWVEEKKRRREERAEKERGREERKRLREGIGVETQREREVRERAERVKKGRKIGGLGGLFTGGWEEWDVDGNTE